MNIYNKIKKMMGQKSYDEKLYSILNVSSYAEYPWQKEDLGEGMFLISQVIREYWKPRFILNDRTKCAYEFMNSEEYMVTVTKDDINWESLGELCDKALEVAETVV